MTWSKLLMISVCLLFLLLVSIPFAGASNDYAVIVVLTKAEEVSASAYEAILEAEQAGANVSSLLDRLNLAGAYLAEASVWYRLGDSENASRFADLCNDIVEDVRREALELRDEAKSLEATDFVVTIIGSSVGVIIVVAVCSVVWRVFKRNHYRKVLGLKPEVVSGES